MVDTESGQSPLQSDIGRKTKSCPGIGLPAGNDYPNLDSIGTEPCLDVFWRKEVMASFETANNGYSFYRIENSDAVFAKDLSGYFYRLNNASRCFEFLFEGFKDTTDYTRINLPPQAPTFVGFNYLHQAVFPINEDGKPILPKNAMGQTIFPYYENLPLFPVDDSGAVCVPLGDDGKPVFPRIPEEFGAYVPCDVTGRVVLPYDEKKEPIYPRDEEGNVLMPFVIMSDGTRKRAVLTNDQGSPILPYTNGEPALEVHNGEVLFQYEYQQKMMMMAQYGPENSNDQLGTLVDMQFYQQHAFQYQNSQETHGYYAQSHGSMNPAMTQAPTTKTTNLLHQQLSFLKKKVDNKTSPVTVQASAPVIPSDRPEKPNKEKKLAERYIPEPSRRYNRSRPNVRSPRRRERSRSNTWSPSPPRKEKKYEKNNKTSRSPRTDKEYRSSSRRYSTDYKKSSKTYRS